MVMPAIKIKKPVDLTKIVILISPFLVLDWLELLGRFDAPGRLSEFSCFILPFAKTTSFLISHRLVDFAESQCVGQLHEPAPSIIFYMLKMTVALLIGGVMASWIYIIPVWFLPAKLKNIRSDAFSRIAKNIEAKGGVLSDIRNVGPFITCLVLFCFVVGFVDTPPSLYGRSLANKVMEDFMCLTISVTTLIFVGCSLSYVYYGLRQMKTS